MGGLPTGTVNGFAVDPSNANVMYVAMRDGIFRSTNGGGRWTPAASGPKNVAAITVNPKKPNEVYAAMMDSSLVRSVDGGVHWTAMK